MSEIVIAAIQHGYLYSRKLDEDTIAIIRTNHLLGKRSIGFHGRLTIMQPQQIHLIQTSVYMQYQIPGTELRLTLDPCSNHQFDWTTPTTSELHHFILVEGA